MCPEGLTIYPIIHYERVKQFTVALVISYALKSPTTLHKQVQHQCGPSDSNVALLWLLKEKSGQPTYMSTPICQMIWVNFEVKIIFKA